MIYLDNAATSFPKPEGVGERMRYYVEQVGATVNRSSYAAAREAGLTALSLRERLCRLFSFPHPSHVILTSGATAGLNLLLKGLLRPGDHCIVSAMEHNAVMRPLVQLERQGVRFDRAPCGGDGRLVLDALPRLFRNNTRLVLMAHASNVCGVLQDARAVGELCAARGVPFALDAAQSAGHVPIHFEELKLSALVAPGHKGLLGPQGIGAALLSPDLAARLDPLWAGGTGSASDSEEVPDLLPDRFEPGTPNLPGIYGWERALAYLEERGVEALMAHEQALTARLLAGLPLGPGLRLAGPAGTENRVGVFSLDFLQMDNAEAAWRLEEEFGVLTRCGLHCAPSAHKVLGTFPQGSVRLSLGFASTEADVDGALTALEKILSGTD